MMTCKCEIKWIDGNGNDTADSNDAIGVALCHSVYDDGTRDISRPYRICEAHAGRAPGFRAYEPGRFGMLSTEWEIVRGMGNILALASHHRQQGRLDLADYLVRQAHAINGASEEV